MCMYIFDELKSLVMLRPNTILVPDEDEMSGLLVRGILKLSEFNLRQGKGSNIQMAINFELIHLIAQQKCANSKIEEYTRVADPSRKSVVKYYLARKEALRRVMEIIQKEEEKLIAKRARDHRNLISNLVSNDRRRLPNS